MGVHFELLVDKQGGCTLPMLVGDPETGTLCSVLHMHGYDTRLLVGKSTAAKCALSLCGQQHVGHIMKTYATSDSMVAERMVNSTLPFVLDDPKGPEDIGEILITVYDGALSGNMRKGLRKPRSLPIFSCNFEMSAIQRYVC